GRVRRLRDGDALKIRRVCCAVIRQRELRNEPAVGDLIVENDRVAIVVGIAPVSRIPTISGPETVDRSHGLQDVTGFVPDHETRIDDLNVMVWADRAVRVWRVSPG